LFCSNEAQTKRFHDIFERRNKCRERPKQYNIVFLPLYQGFMMKTKLPATRITRFLNAIIKFNIKTAIRKTEYHFKELTTLSVGDYVTHIDE
jgi:transcription-repair coupling factor (superfamily II helicase)